MHVVISKAKVKLSAFKVVEILLEEQTCIHYCTQAHLHLSTCVHITMGIVLIERLITIKCNL